MTNLKIGNVYKIICSVSDDVYVGSTFSTLRNRWTAHKKNYNDWISGKKDTRISIYPYFEKYGIDKFKIIKIKEYECVDKNHLESKEQLWISKSRCVNTNNTIRIKKMCAKLYYDNNKEKSREYCKEYRENNKEKIKENSKKYYENNADDIKKKVNLYRKENKGKIEEYSKTYRKNNKGKIEEYQKKPYTCLTCNTTIKIGGVLSHKKTQKHLKNLK